VIRERRLGGYTLAEQERREQLRLKAAELFEQGESASAVAAELRVTSRTVRQWRRR
jgi:putative transposase